MSRFNAEGAVIGAALVDPQAFWKVADLLTADDFANAEHRALWEEISNLLRAGKPADAVTIGESKPALWSIATSCANAAFSTSNVRGYAEWIVADSIQRKVVLAGQRIAKLQGADCLAEAQRIMASCQPRAVGAVRPIRDYLHESAALMQERCDAVNAITGIETSIEWLDELTAGFQRSDLVVIAARPSVGKTALALQCGLHAAMKGHPIFFASLEQSGAQLAERALAHVSGVSMKHITQPKRIEDDAEWRLISQAGVKLEKLPILIDQTGSLTVDAICARVRQAHALNALGMVLIDYLQQIAPPKADKLTDAIQLITRALKALAKELNITVILLSQLNREGEDKPILKNLRDSGSIEQDADIVIFLHRPDQNRRELLELIVAKHRNGPIDSTYVNGSMALMKFTTTSERPSKKKAGWGTTAAEADAA